MFVVSKPNPTNFDTGCFGASSSCHSEYNSKIEAVAHNSINGLRGTLCRNSSNLSHKISELQETCLADAVQIEINFSSLNANKAFFVRIDVPTGEQGVLHFSPSSAEFSQVFTPIQNGCGHGVWKFSVCTMENGSEIAHSQVSRNLDGVGILFFNVFPDLEIRLTQQEFLHISHCHTRRH